MAQDDYGPEDRAELIADSLGIMPSSYAGRTADATAAMALLAGYRRMARLDQSVLRLSVPEGTRADDQQSKLGSGKPVQR